MFSQQVKRPLFTFLAVVFCVTAINSPVLAHCQVPCGIYDDYARVLAMLEDVTTIEKSIVSIKELSGKKDAQSKNQLVRWVNTKEMHAEKIISTISNYFLTQRVKPSQEDYLQRLKKHHAVILNAMKAKQTVSAEVAAELKKNVEALVPYYHSHKEKGKK